MSSNIFHKEAAFSPGIKSSRFFFEGCEMGNFLLFSFMSLIGGWWTGTCHHQGGECHTVVVRLLWLNIL